MKIKTRFKFLEKVILKTDKTIEMLVTDLQVKVDGSYVYGLLDSKGETKWRREYELESKTKEENKLGFIIDIDDN